MKDKPLYVISIVSEMLGLHPQTLRQYERIGLIIPSRTEGNTRLYSEEDVERLKYIAALTKDMGVNLAGVEIIMKMRDQIEALNARITDMGERLKSRYGEGMLSGRNDAPERRTTKIKIERE